MSRLLVLLLLLVIQSCDKNPYGKGMNSYNKHCADCHGIDGVGLAALIPPLKNSDYLREQQDKIACIIRNGLDTSITVNQKVFDFQKMPPNDKLDEIEIANIINFINNAWGNKREFIEPQVIIDQLKECTIIPTH